MNFSALARLRPQMPLDTLSGLFGEGIPVPGNTGFIFPPHDCGCSVRINVEGTLGQVAFYKSFPSDQLIEGLHIGMPLEQARTKRPGLTWHPNAPKDPPEWTCYKDKTAEGHELLVLIRDDAILSLQLTEVDPHYPEPRKWVADPFLTQAYDIDIEAPQRHPAASRDSSWANGWTHGLPPGITPTQWPLSLQSGLPLRHAFTLYLPAPYRKQGDDRVALSIFVDEQFEDVPDNEEVSAFFDAPLSSEPPTDPDLSRLWTHRQQRHPLHFDMEDILGTHFAALWLTQAEFDGPLCKPPTPIAHAEPPGWMQEDTGIAHPLRISEREGDPNVGKPAREWEEECEQTGYIRPFTSEQGVALQLERFHGRNHLGGTMFPVQAFPEFGPYYLEFEENFGGFNFGGGNAQIDLEQMKLDWACG